VSEIRTRSGHRAVRLDPVAVDNAGLAAWRELADRAAEPNPFFRPEFLLANVIERHVPAELLVVVDGSRWLACLPVQRRGASLRFPLPALVAVTDEYSFSGTPLLDRDALDTAADGLLDLIRAERRAAVLMIGIFETSGPVGIAMTRAAERAGTRLREHSSFARAGWWRSAQDHFPGPAFTAHDRRQMVRRARRMSAELGGAITIVDRTMDPDAWEQFLAMENSSWKADRGTALGSTERDAAFFRRMCAGLSRSGQFEIVALQVGEHTVAMESSLIDGTSLFAFKIAFDPQYREYSPGTILKYRLIERLEGSTMTVGDSCAAPDNGHMNRLWPDRRVMRTLVLPTGSPLGTLLPPLLAARAIGRRIRDEVARRRAGRPRGQDRPPTGRPTSPEGTAQADQVDRPRSVSRGARGAGDARDALTRRARVAAAR
jgi:CelD/BcsL family acetyltransferase involved in cellulose biosynthesis